MFNNATGVQVINFTKFRLAKCLLHAKVSSISTDNERPKLCSI